MLGARTILFIPNKYSTLLLGVLTLLIAAYSYNFNNSEMFKRESSSSSINHFTGYIALFFLGFLNGSLTSGTGLFVTMWLVKWFKLSYKIAIAHTLVLVGLVWNSTGAIALGVNNDIKWNWLPSLIIGSLVGGYLGAHFSIIEEEKIIKKSFEIITTVIGLSLLSKGFFL